MPSPAPYPSFDLGKVRVFPLAERKSLTRVEDILVEPSSIPKAASEKELKVIRECAAAIRQARERKAGVMLIYGAHLLRNGAALILEKMMGQKCITHLATNGAGTIHDWEYAHFGRSTESVEENVSTGTFGTWDETARNIHWALYAGGLRGEGYGEALGRYIQEDGADFPRSADLRDQLLKGPELAPAVADLLGAQAGGFVPESRVEVKHPWKHASIMAQAYRHRVPFSVHPGIGYDIISNHPIFNGAVIGRAATQDFKVFAQAVESLDGGVVLSVGSAIMGPQVFEKTLSCVNNVRIQEGRPIVSGHSIYVVDLQDGGGWDWTLGEPPKTNPAYYLRFCKSYSRMGGAMQYLQFDNLGFIHHLFHQLNAP